MGATGDGRTGEGDKGCEDGGCGGDGMPCGAAGDDRAGEGYKGGRSGGGGRLARLRLSCYSPRFMLLVCSFIYQTVKIMCYQVRIIVQSATALLG